MGKSNKNKSSVLPIGRIERQFWKKKIDLKKKLDSFKLRFQFVVRIFVSETLTPYNQNLAWGVGVETSWHICWSAKGIVKV